MIILYRFGGHITTTLSKYDIRFIKGVFVYNKRKRPKFARTYNTGVRGWICMVVEFATKMLLRGCCARIGSFSSQYHDL